MPRRNLKNLIYSLKKLIIVIIQITIIIIIIISWMKNVSKMALFGKFNLNIM